jgi:hypothetical protein
LEFIFPGEVFQGEPLSLCELLAEPALLKLQDPRCE